MRVDVVESIPERGAQEGEGAENAAVRLALQSFQSAIQGDESFFDSRREEGWHMTRAGDGREICIGSFVLSFRDKKMGRERGLHFQLIQQLIELLKNAGSPEILGARLCLIPETQDGSAPGGLALRIQLEAVGESNEQAALRWGLGLAHLQQALLFTSRYLQQQILQKNG